jgi:peptidoglycan/LPS O-acetylase OafA/YrhL
LATVASSTSVARIDSLTGLRILAAGVVCLSHLGAPEWSPAPLQAFFKSGYNGVTLFFILSGFVLAWNYGDRLGDRMTGRSLWSFGVARLARIYPLYLLALVWVVTPLWLENRDTPFLWHHILSVQTWNPSVKVAYSYNGPGWSIGVELFLYACFPLLLLLLRPIRRNARMLLLTAAVAVAAAGVLVGWFMLTGNHEVPRLDPEGAHRWLYRTPLTRLGDFVLGMTAAFLLRLAPADRPAWWGRSAQAVGGLAILAFMVTPQLVNTAVSFDLIYMVPAFLLIVGLVLTPTTLLGRALSTKPMVLMGEASFAFYLLHSPLLKQLLPESFKNSYADWVLAGSLTIFLILCVSIGVHIAFERPARRFVRRVLDPAPKARTPRHSAVTPVAEPEPVEAAGVAAR